MTPSDTVATRTFELPGGARACFTSRADGDMGHGGVHVQRVSPAVEARRRAVVDLPWTWLRQVHGDHVVTVTSPGDGAGTPADAAVTAEAGCALAVLTADCAPVALGSPEGVVGVAHAGWAGLVAGVVARTVEAMAALGATSLSAVVGPCIGPECYDFGSDDLDAVAAAVGPEVRARTSAAHPALDLRAGVEAALGREGVDDVTHVAVCTACSAAHWSWRARREHHRQALVVWR